MLVINIPSKELFDNNKQEFIQTKPCTLQFEHSLISISKWESKWKKSFISNIEKSNEETIDYIKCMLLNEEDSIYVNQLTSDDIQIINDYIADPMSATVFFENESNSKKKETITSELIYYWMIASNIPKECENWHLNRLLTLIRICSIKNAPPKKMTRKEIMDRNRVLNEARKKKLNTKG